jgi:pimeloyl-ACP methyl ester carboxylesterase
MRRYRTLMLLTLLALRVDAGASTSAAAERGQAAAMPMDALAYTVVRTPPAERIPLTPIERDRNVLVDRVQPFPDRELPDVFWYDRAGMSYGLVYQKTRAPLVFLIAGTGGSFNTDTNKLLAQTLYQEGFHVLGFPSPTHPNFIVNASETGVPGRMADDARDLYRVMRMAYQRVKDRIEVSDVHLAGYSLGGTHAAWVAKLDQQEQAIGFDKVLLLNPSVSLYNSVNALDAMYDRRVADDPEAAQAVIDRIFTRFAEVYTREQEVSFDGDFLYRAYQEFQPGVEALETLIGTSFRYTLVNLAFTADVMSRGGYMVPPDAELGSTTSLTNFYKHAFRKSFVDYLDGLYLPYFQRQDPALTRERAIFEAGLLPLEGWLAGNPRIGVITNRDDIILEPDELAWLERTFGSRVVVLPDGGHCGNYQRRDFADALVRFFRR